MSAHRKFLGRTSIATPTPDRRAAWRSLSFDITTSTLRDAALAPTTLRAYNKQLDTFLASAGCSLKAMLLRPPQQIDALLAHYIAPLLCSPRRF